MKAFITSQFSYCPLVWMFHSRTLNNRINKIHERALRLGHRKLRIWSHLLRKSLMENFIFCAVLFGNDLTKHVKDLAMTNKLKKSESYCQSKYSNNKSKKICKILLQVGRIILGQGGEASQKSLGRLEQKFPRNFDSSIRGKFRTYF